MTCRVLLKSENYSFYLWLRKVFNPQLEINIDMQWLQKAK